MLSGSVSTGGVRTFYHDIFVIHLPGAPQRQASRWPSVQAWARSWRYLLDIATDVEVRCQCTATAESAKTVTNLVTVYNANKICTPLSNQLKLRPGTTTSAPN